MLLLCSPVSGGMTLLLGRAGVGGQIKSKCAVLERRRHHKTCVPDLVNPELRVRSVFFLLGAP